MIPYLWFKVNSVFILTKSADIILNFMGSKTNNLHLSIKVKPRVKIICSWSACYPSNSPPETSLINKFMTDMEVSGSFEIILDSSKHSL